MDLNSQFLSRNFLALINYSVWWLMRKNKLKPNIMGQVSGRNKIARVGVLFYCFINAWFFSKTNHFTVNTKCKCGKHHVVEVYSFTCCMILLYCVGCVGSCFICGGWVLRCVGTWVAWVKTLCGSSDPCMFIKFQRWSINFLSGYKLWRRSKIWRSSKIFRMSECTCT